MSAAGEEAAVGLAGADGSEAAANASDAQVRRIADAVLYEGYLLWPYRKDALKNRQRFTFGGVYPPAWELDRASVQTQALLEGTDARVEVAARCLQVVRRQVLRREPRSRALRPVDELDVAGETLISWDEAVEREFAPGPARIAAGEELETVTGGAVRRSWEALTGDVALVREALAPDLTRVCVRVTNTTPWSGGAREEALRRTFCSLHVVLHATGGAWVSLTDPPPRLREQAQACENDGLWPVMVGEPPRRDTLLAAPIILPDYPAVAPESPGDLFDASEIDQLLVLGILSLTEDERRAMRACDPRARAILERTEALSEEQILRLNGAVREFGLVRELGMASALTGERPS